MCANREVTRLPLSTYLLSLGQAFNLTAAVLSVTISALVGQKFAPEPALATLPYGVQFAVVMFFTFPAAMLMRRWGRRLIFQFGAGLLMASGVVGYFSVAAGSFSGLVAAHALLGGYVACANFYRFAAVDNLPLDQKPRGISLVVAGGVLAAILGPLLSSLLKDVPGYAEFSLCYGAFCGLSFLTWVMLLFWKPLAIDQLAVTQISAEKSRGKVKVNRFIVLAILASALGYLLMNLLMVQASLVMSGICSFDAASFAIQGHVLAMFAPSFITGALIARFGLRVVLSVGFLLLAGASAIGVAYLRYDAVFVGLVLLGLGWNLAYVGGGALLAQKTPDNQRHAWQGFNDTVIAACATLGAILPAPMLTWLGWSGTNLFSFALSAVLAIASWMAFSSFGLRRTQVEEVSGVVAK